MPLKSSICHCFNCKLYTLTSLGERSEEQFKFQDFTKSCSLTFHQATLPVFNLQKQNNIDSVLSAAFFPPLSVFSFSFCAN